MKCSLARQENRGFTALEFFLVLIVLVLAAVIILPEFVKPRTTTICSACMANLKQIEGAKEQWALENKLTKGTPSNDSAINAYLRNSAAPACPANGTYQYNPLGTPPSCSLEKSDPVRHSIR